MTKFLLKKPLNNNILPSYIEITENGISFDKQLPTYEKSYKYSELVEICKVPEFNNKIVLKFKNKKRKIYELISINEMKSLVEELSNNKHFLKTIENRPSIYNGRRALALICFYFIMLFYSLFPYFFDFRFGLGGSARGRGLVRMNNSYWDFLSNYVSGYFIFIIFFTIFAFLFNNINVNRKKTVQTQVWKTVQN